MPAQISRGRIRAEIAVVLALSFGASAVYAIVSIVERVTRETSLAAQTATINRPLADRAAFDLTSQLLGVAFGLAPVALVIFLLWQSRSPHLGRLGLSPRIGAWWLRDTGWGVLLATTIGVPGLAFYLFARGIGINVNVVPTTLDAYWWTVPVLVLAALRAALSEELIVVGYLFGRLKDLGWRPWTIIFSTALLRGSYHLYQGFGGFIGNVAMGVLFGWAYQRFGRILPLIIAHWILDIVSFVGYGLAVALWPALFTADTA
jgi:membrane protease YdiL (CAAX protease family)